MAVPMLDKNMLEEDKKVYLKIYRKDNGDVSEIPSSTVETKRTREARKCEVFPYTPEDAKKMISYFQKKEQWIHYLMFTLSYNMARRVGDTLQLKWKNFFDPKTGNFRENILEIKEQKTNKIANPRINVACRDAINLYVEKMHIDVSANDYDNFVFLQTTGTYPGKVISERGCLSAIKKAAAANKIEYNVGTHSARKSFGAISKEIHPSDCNSLETIQTILNHSDSKTTMRYIGLTKKKVDSYFDAAGTFYQECIVGDKPVEDISSPVVHMYKKDVLEMLAYAYNLGLSKSNETSPATHVLAMNELTHMLDGKMI